MFTRPLVPNYRNRMRQPVLEGSRGTRQVRSETEFRNAIGDVFAGNVSAIHIAEDITFASTVNITGLSTRVSISCAGDARVRCSTNGATWLKTSMTAAAAVDGAALSLRGIQLANVVSETVLFDHLVEVASGDFAVIEMEGIYGGINSTVIDNSGTVSLFRLVDSVFLSGGGLNGSISNGQVNGNLITGPSSFSGGRNRIHGNTFSQGVTFTGVSSSFIGNGFGPSVSNLDTSGSTATGLLTGNTIIGNFSINGTRTISASKYDSVGENAMVSSTTDVTAATYTAGGGEQHINADCTSNAITISLPAASTMAGRWLNVKKIDSTGNVVTIDPNGSETIDGATTISLTMQYESVTLYSDGTEWWIR